MQIREGFKHENSLIFFKDQIKTNLNSMKFYFLNILFVGLSFENWNTISSSIWSNNNLLCPTRIKNLFIILSNTVYSKPFEI